MLLLRLIYLLLRMLVALARVIAHALALALDALLLPALDVSVLVLLFHARESSSS